MNVLPLDKQVRAISALVEGCSIRSTERLTGIHRDTIMRLGVRVGEGCERLHGRLMRGLNVAAIELDEQWAFIGKKQKRVDPDDPHDAGDAYLFIALAANAKAAISFVVGKRTAENTLALASDLRSRITNRPQITSDGFQAYPDAIDFAFGMDVDFAQLVKAYQATPGNEAAPRYSPGTIGDTETKVVRGMPDPGKISTSYVERFNLTTRMQMRRFTRLTNGFSKKLENHKAAIALHIAHYNLCRVHETIRVTPAMALGVTDHVRTIGELVEAALAPPVSPLLVPEPHKGTSAARAKGEKRGSGPGRWLRLIPGGKGR